MAAGRRRRDRRGRVGRRAGRRPARRSRRSRRDAGSRQHAPPPLPDPHARPGAGSRPFRMASRALSGLVADRRRGGVRRSPHGTRRARALRLLDRLRPPLRLPARADRPRSRPRFRRRASSEYASSPPAARWTSASPTAGFRPTSSSRTSTPFLPTPSGSWPSCTSKSPVPASRSPSHRARRSRSRRSS